MEFPDWVQVKMKIALNIETCENRRTMKIFKTKSSPLTELFINSKTLPFDELFQIFEPYNQPSFHSQSV